MHAGSIFQYLQQNEWSAPEDDEIISRKRLDDGRQLVVEINPGDSFCKLTILDVNGIILGTIEFTNGVTEALFASIAAIIKARQ